MDRPWLFDASQQMITLANISCGRDKAGDGDFMWTSSRLPYTPVNSRTASAMRISQFGSLPDPIPIAPGVFNASGISDPTVSGAGRMELLHGWCSIGNEHLHEVFVHPCKQLFLFWIESQGCQVSVSFQVTSPLRVHYSMVNDGVVHTTWYFFCIPPDRSSVHVCGTLVPPFHQGLIIHYIYTLTLRMFADTQAWSWIMSHVKLLVGV